MIFFSFSIVASDRVIASDKVWLYIYADKVTFWLIILVRLEIFMPHIIIGKWGTHLREEE